jgi:hypothetical protein
MAQIEDEQLLAMYSRDFTTDKSYGQLSVVSILTESVAQLTDLIPEIATLPVERKAQIEEKIVLFTLSLYHEGRLRGEAAERSTQEADSDRLSNYE